jgi:beta-phosphoglucomutase-like phosphatase (HAD superfamily)
VSDSPPVAGAVVFDFDGVIADSEPLHLRSFRHVLSEIGLELTDEAYYQRYLGYSDDEAFAAVGRDQGRPLDEAARARLRARKAALMPQLLGDPSILFPGASRAIDELAASFPLAIASGALREEIELVLDAHGLRSSFAVIVAAGETPRGKPAPDPYLRALAELERLGLVDRGATSVAIEDSAWGLRSAAQAGMRTIAVASSYAPDTLSADLVLAKLADLSIDHVWTLMRRA